MNIYHWIGLALCATVACLLPGIKNTEYASGIRVVFGLLAFSFCFSRITPYFGLIRRFSEYGSMADYFPMLSRAIGIAFLFEVGATVCRDTGEESMAKSMEFIAKTEILILTFPLIKQLFDAAEGLLNKV